MQDTVCMTEESTSDSRQGQVVMSSALYSDRLWDDPAPCPVGIEGTYLGGRGGGGPAMTLTTHLHLVPLVFKNELSC